MYRWLLIAHGLFRWIVILAGVAVVAAAVWSLVRRELYERRHSALGRVFATAVDTQVVVGTLLYAVFSPLTAPANRLGITAPPGSEMHFFTATHVQIMATVLVAVHVASAIIRRGKNSRAQLWRTGVCYGLTLVLLLFGVPWFRPLVRI
jgi:hypothetical protein